MLYLTEATKIRQAIAQLTTAKILWVDTEVADWNTSHPRLSLIQVLPDTNINQNSVFVLDVLNQSGLVADFVSQIMANPKIEKVFHNANYDLKFLGKELAKNVTCTLKIAKKITKERLQVPNLQLKTLASKLCNIPNIDKQGQSSDWSRRPLTEKQLQYAKLDPVYLAHIHRHLLEIIQKNSQNIPISQTTAMTSFSATKVRVAFECPRLFYLQHKFGGKTLFLPSDRQTAIGNDFHKLAGELIDFAKRDSEFKALFLPPTEQLNPEKIAMEMQQLFYNQVFFPYLEAAIKEDASKAPALLQIWEGLIKFIHHWAELLIKNRRYCQANALISRTLVTGELPIEHDFILPDGTQQRIVGRLDSLVYDFERNRFCVVEFKTYQPADTSAQLAQVALYSYMLKQKKNLPVDSAIYCVLPAFKEYYYAWEELEDTVHQRIPEKLQQMRQWLTWKSGQLNRPPATIQPHLCQICPQQQKCQTFFGNQEEIYSPTTHSQIQPKNQEEIDPTTHSQVQPGNEIKEAPPLAKSTPNADEIGQELVSTFESFGIKVDYLNAVLAPAFIRVKLKPHLGVKVVSLLNRAQDLQVQLGLAQPPMIAPQAGYVSVDLPRSDRQIAKLEDYIPRQSLPPTAPVKIAIGVNLDGELVEADLSDPNTCHFLVGGTTGSGKSEFLRSLLLSLLYSHSPQQLKIALVDPKRVTFPEFEQIPWLYAPVIKDDENAIALTNNLVAEMESRYHQFETIGCANITDYNQQAAKPLPRIVCIFDEYADFMTEKEIRNGLESSIKRLGAMARAAGIHLIVATQRPEAKVVTPLIRSNLPGRVALRTASEADSIIVLGGNHKAAANLLGKGDLLYQVGSQLQRLQSLFARAIAL
jgi:DNA segregation ATPase FtsK/SpoIIIE, S-DNA-T family